MSSITRRRAASLLSLLTAVVLGVATPDPAGAVPQVPSGGRASVSSAEAQADGDSLLVDVSADGRFVLFNSDAPDLVAADTNGESDGFVRDVVAGTTTRVTVADDESQAQDRSVASGISDDGRRVVFLSDADNLVAGDAGGFRDIFVRDLVAGTTTRVSVNSAEEAGDDDSFSPGISGDGTKVAFASDAANLVTGDTNEVNDVFQRDLVAGTTIRISVSTTEGQSEFSSVGSAMDQDGSVVVFQTEADDLIGANDTNGDIDIYARRLDSQTTIRVSVSAAGTQADGNSFSGRVDDSGTRFVWESDAQDLVADDGDGQRDVFVRSIAIGGTTERVTVDTTGGDGSGFDSSPSINGQGTEVAFTSRSDDLVATDTNGTEEDAFVRDLVTDVTRIVSVRPGTVVNGPTDGAALADNGMVALESTASNLVPGDTNDRYDVFVAGEACDGRVVTVDRNRGAAPTAGADVILGTPGTDTVNGLGGADRFCGGAGNDVFRGGAGNDRAFGGVGNDTLRGDDGNDRVDGGSGNDRLLGGNGNDVLLGVGGTDALEGGNGGDQLNGGAARDSCKGQAGRDRAAGCEVRTGFP
jgi:Ca2+-binding RTX toxin-like protein